MKKSGLLVIFLLLFSTLGAAQTVEFQDWTFKYADSDSPSNGDKLVINCKNNDCPEASVNYNYWVYACGTVARAYPKDGGLVDTTANKYVVDNPVPQGGLVCPVGTHSPVRMEVENCGVNGCTTKLDQSGGSLTVLSNNMEDDHKGKYLFAELDENIPRLHDFMITDDYSAWAGGANSISETPQPGDILVQEDDWGANTKDDYALYRIDSFGINKITPSSTALSDLTVSQKFIGNNGGALPDGEGADDVWTHPFHEISMGFGGNGAPGCTSYNRKFNECSPVHSSSAYQPEEEIVLAREPITLTSDNPAGADPYYWWICRDGATMNNQYTNSNTEPQTVAYSKAVGNPGPNQVGAVENTPLKCNPSTGNWNEVTRCNDNLDNDGDSDIDSNDDTCSYSDYEDPSKTSISDCPSATVAKYNGQKQAFYGLNTGGSYTVTVKGKSCTYDYKDDNIERGSYYPDTFTCHKTDSKNDFSYYLDSTEMENFCNSISDYTFRKHNNVPSGVTVGDLTMKAVRYVVPRHAIPYGEKFASGINDADPDTGFNNDRYIHLHRIEKLNDASPGSLSCDRCHDASFYSSINMTDLGGYQSGTVSDYINAWIPGNATDLSNPEVLDVSNSTPPGGWVNVTGIFGGDPTTSDSYGGGFFGDCKTGLKWVYTQDASGNMRWLCSNALQWEQQAYIPKLESGDSSNPAGIFIFPYNFQTSTTYSNGPNVKPYYRAKEELEGSGETLDRMVGVCWNNQDTTKATFDAANKVSNGGSTWFAKEVTGISTTPTNPIPLTGTLDVQGNGLTCRWIFENSAGDTVDCEGTTKVFGYNKLSSDTDAQTYLENTVGLSSNTMNELTTSSTTPNEWSNIVSSWKTGSTVSKANSIDTYPYLKDGQTCTN